jgi:hypothetical protein
MRMGRILGAMLGGGLRHVVTASSDEAITGGVAMLCEPPGNVWRGLPCSSTSLAITLLHIHCQYLVEYLADVAPSPFPS